MDFTITLKPDAEYYEEAYSEMIISNRFKKLEPFFAIAMVLFAFALWNFDKNNALGYFPFIFGALGVYELIKVYTAKKKWINDRVRGGITGQEIILQFTESLIVHTGPLSTGNISWAGIRSIKQTQKGLILKQDAGNVIYLPITSFQNKNQINFIVNKVQI